MKMSSRAEDAFKIHVILSGGPDESSAAVTRATLGIREMIERGASLADLAIALGGIARIQADLAKHEPEESMVTFQSFVEVGFDMFEGIKDKLEAAQKQEDPNRHLNPKLN